MRFCIENVSCKTLFACIFALHHLIFQFFWQKRAPRPGWEAHFWKTTSNIFDQKFYFFDPQTSSKWSTFVNFACSCRSVVLSLRYVLAPCPFQKQPVARLPCSFRLRAPFAKTTVCITIAILWMSFAICYFLSAFHALQTLFFQNFVIFCKICSRPGWEACFWKTHVSNVA